MKKISKRKIAGFLAACMVSSILPPALPAHARQEGPVTTTGVAAEFIFDSGYGPKATWTYIGAGSNPVDTSDPTKDILSGITGDRLYNNYFKLKQDPRDFSGYGPNSRPAIPDMTTAWAGYEFDDWYEEPNGVGNKLTKLPYAFADYKKTTYFANWIGDSAVTSNYQVTHQRILPNGSGSPVVFNEEKLPVSARTTVGAKAKRTGIPGYTYAHDMVSPEPSASFSPQYFKAYNGAYTTNEVGSFSNTSYGFNGNMPNEELKVVYRYIPNQATKFTVKLEYVDVNGTTIKSPDTESFSAEDAIIKGGIDFIQKDTIAGYSYSGYQIITGNTDLLGGSVVNPVYGLDTAGGNWNGDDSYTGWMPNQNVTIRYRYTLDGNYVVRPQINYKDIEGVNLRTIPGLIDGSTYPLAESWNPNPSDLTFVFDVPNTLNGYEDVFYPTASIDGAHLNAQRVVDAGNNVKVKVTGFTQVPAITADIVVELTYNRSAANWAKVFIECGPNGTIGGDVTARQYEKGRNYTLNELVGHLTVQPALNYVKTGITGDGWYIVGAGGVLTEVTGSIPLNSDITLRARFEKDSTKWHDVKFVAGSHGTVASSNQQNVVNNTPFSALNIPSTTPKSGYYRLGWFDQNNNPVNPGDSITGDMVYEMKFALIAVDPDYDELNRPNAYGQVAGDGTGEVVIRDMVEDRSYAVTDRDGLIVAIVKGNNNIATGLPPSDYYEVYEFDSVLTPTADTLVGTAISNVADILKSYPAVVIVPAVGAQNSAVKPDNQNSGRVQIIVNPTAPNTVYALMDEDGQVVMVSDADADGWVTPDASSRVVFDNLEPNLNYKVVAKNLGGTEQPADRSDYGSNLYADGSQVQSDTYVIQTINGSITSYDGQFMDETFIGNAEAQKSVRVTAPSTNAGNSFITWRVLMGDIGFTPAAGDSALNFTMKSNNVLLVAIYDVPTLGTASNATVDFKVVTKGDGNIALNMSADQIAQLAEDLTSATHDQPILDIGREVEYQIYFKQRTAKATVSDAVKAETAIADEAFRAAWQMDVTLHRYVDGSARPVTDESAPGTFEVYVQLSRNDCNFEEYELWELVTDSSGDVTITQVSMDPDLNTSPGNGGMFKFRAEVEASYLLCYARSNQVRLEHAKTGAVKVVKVYRGTDVTAYTDYTNWQSALDPVITDPDGKPWNYKGLSTKKENWREYQDNAVTKDLTLYAYYEVDQDWVDARTALENGVRDADRLINSNISDDAKDAIRDAVADANDILNKTNPGPTTSELKDALDSLKKAIDEVGGSETDPDWQREKEKLEKLIKEAKDYLNNNNVSTADKDRLEAAIGDAEDALNKAVVVQDITDGYNDLKNVYDSVRNNNNNNNKSKGGGGGGGTKKVDLNLKNYATYTSGTDGSWDLVDPQSNSWVFNLAVGKRVSNTWAYIKYVNDGVTVTYLYHFDAEGIMNSGWFLDSDGRWYYLSTAHDGWFGHMKTGWHLDPNDSRWYYLESVDGHMLTGWKELGGQWYYFNQEEASQTWAFNPAHSQWEYLKTDYRPYGSMYIGEETPDGYRVGNNGALTE